jgi:hypothetical protein
MYSSLVDVYVSFLVTYPVFFVSEGYFEIKYKIDNSETNAFKVLVDD